MAAPVHLEAPIPAMPAADTRRLDANDPHRNYLAKFERNYYGPWDKHVMLNVERIRWPSHNSCAHILDIPSVD
jgi:hypothetical protein